MGVAILQASVPLVMLAGCPEYSATDTVEFDVSFNALFHRNAFGGEVGDCALEVAFLEPGGDDGFGGDGEPPTQIPEEPGTCAVTYYEREDEEPDDSEYAPWIQGSLDAGGAAWLDTGAETLELTRFEDDTEYITYLLEDCDESSFPFGAELDLLVAPDEELDDAVPEFSLQQALGVGPELSALTPVGHPVSGDFIELYQDEDLELVWSHLGVFPVVGEITVEPELILHMWNQEPDHFTFEYVMCLPDSDGSFVIPSEIFEQLTPQPPGEPDYYGLALQLDVIYHTMDYPTPWGMVSNRRCRMSDGGYIRLMPPP